jgi:hypothetical protein
MKKKCCKCGQEKLLEEFATDKRKSFGKDGRCKKCFSAKAKEIRIRNSRWVYAYLLEHPCIDCGEADPMCLDFDHVDRSTKKTRVSTLVQRYCRLETIKEEIEKCEVRCANCHRRKTIKELGQYKWLSD